jgi:hypothetical protein
MDIKFCEERIKLDRIRSQVKKEHATYFANDTSRKLCDVGNVWEN